MDIETLLSKRPDLKVQELLVPEQCALCENEKGDLVHVTVENGSLVVEPYVEN